MARPTFLFIGPDKTGSTWMYEILRRHPQAWVPPVKDIYFFDRHYDRGIDWYLSFFEDAPADAMAVGELSHDYLFSPVAAERIREHLPQVKILTCLRDPAERTYSHYLYLIRSGLTRLPFEEALDEFPELVDNSRYHRHLKAYFRRFDRDQIAVLWFADLKEDAEQFGRHLLRQLNLPFRRDLPYDERFLPASSPRIPVLARAMKWGAELARSLGLAELVGRIKRSRAASTLYRPYERSEKPRLNEAGRRRILEDLHDDVTALEDLLGTDLSSWKETELDRGPDGRRRPDTS